MLTKKAFSVFSATSKNGRGQTLIYQSLLSHSKASDAATPSDDGKTFSALELYPKFSFSGKKRTKRQHSASMTKPPRSASMSLHQDWPSVWPAARTFHPASVPLPVRMGFPTAKKPSPDKWANTELMKIPNFLHLTPPAVQRHCAAIRKFCSPWPEGVSYSIAVTAPTRNPDSQAKRFQNMKVVTAQNPCEPEPPGEFGYFDSLRATDASEKNRDKKLSFAKDPPAEQAADDPGYFPMVTTRSTYLYSGPSIRDPRARVASVKVRLQDLHLDYHGQDKLLRLVGDRFDRESNTITITADRCPLYCQNLEYCYYLLTVIRAEAEITEPWEHEQEPRDVARYVYSGSNSEAAVEALKAKRAMAGEAVCTEEDIERYQAATKDLLETDENEGSAFAYGESVFALLGLKERIHDTQSTYNPLVISAADVDLPPIQMDNYNEKRRVTWITHSYRFKTPY